MIGSQMVCIAQIIEMAVQIFFDAKKDNYVYLCETCNKKLFLYVGKCFKKYYTLYIKRCVTCMDKQLNMYVVMEKY